MPAPNRLQLELRRLYLPRHADATGTAPDGSALVDADGRVRAMVLQLARPADWRALSTIWQGVQADLQLPAPAIAVNGSDGYQLWFSLAEPVPAAQAAAFLAAMRARYLGEIGAHRVGLMPSVDPAPPYRVLHADPVPAQQSGGDRWSAFVASDLAPMFADEPWLDMPPNADGQAALLCRLGSIPLAELQRAQQQLATVAAPHDAELPAPASPAPATGAGTNRANPAAAGPWRDPRRFLLDVMNDGTVALGLRIEAAKALLPYADDSRRG